MLSVYLADGHYLSRIGLKSVVESDPQLNLVGEASTRNELFESLSKFSPNVLVVDPESVLQLKYEDLRKIEQTDPSLGILVVTSNPKPANVFQLLEKGISGFVTKECSQQEIQRAILSAGQKEKFYCNKVLELIIDKKNSGEDNCDPTVLSERETEIVRLIAAGKTTSQIAEMLSLSKHTINTHRKNILKKLNLKTPAQVVNFAIKSALVES